MDDLVNELRDLDTKLEDYEKLEIIGEGTFSKVYKVKLNGKIFAMKIIEKNFLIDNHHVNAFFEELKVTKACKGSDFLLPFYDVISDDDKIYIIMDLIEGGELYKHL